MNGVQERMAVIAGLLGRPETLRDENGARNGGSSPNSRQLLGMFGSVSGNTSQLDERAQLAITSHRAPIWVRAPREDGANAHRTHGPYPSGSFPQRCPVGRATSPAQPRRAAARRVRDIRGHLAARAEDDRGGNDCVCRLGAGAGFAAEGLRGREAQQGFGPEAGRRQRSLAQSIPAAVRRERSSGAGTARFGVRIAVPGAANRCGVKRFSQSHH